MCALRGAVKYLWERKVESGKGLMDKKRREIKKLDQCQ
jgi:hypothetical protein